MAKLDTATRDHLEWLGYVQPTGLVVSAPALVRAGAVLAKNDTEGQRLLRSVTHETTVPGQSEPALVAPDFETFASTVLGWRFSPRGYAGTADRPIPDELVVHLHDHGETLAPDYAVIEREPSDDESEWQLLVSVLEPGEEMHQAKRKGGNLEISEHSRLERLLRQTGVPAGLLFNGRVLRLISAPRGESSGCMDFDIDAMMQTPGRPIVAALRLLLSEQALLAKPKNARLAALLAESRKYQNDVSEKLAEQVLHALYELLRGLQTAHDASHGELLKEPLEHDPDQIYRALLTTILRLVFLLYAEERDMLPEDDTYIQHYSIASLHERLREDAGLHPDTMDQRFGAWAQLLVLFRLVYDGADAGNLRLPERHGELFDPDRFPFLEGRTANEDDTSTHVPLVPDGTVYRALEHLLVLEGERISYRALDVEQIGSVYETMMGFRIERAEGRSLAIRSTATHGAPTIVNLDALVATDSMARIKWLSDRLDRTLPPNAIKAIRDAESVTDVHDALDRVVDRRASPDVVPAGALVLQPSDERRRSGSHYTPRELTEPIVRTTLAPIITRLSGDDPRGPTPDQLLDLKVCDPAMGSGAFLVEACRQLGDVLVNAWRAHERAPTIPDDEDDVIFARRLVAQRCIYGVDRNPVAVDLAKVSLWLVTLAREHPLTFLDHALRHGDSLIGLSKKQLLAFDWKPAANNLAGIEVDAHLSRVLDLRRMIRDAPESTPDSEMRRLWHEADSELQAVRLYGDLVIGAYFDGSTARERESKRLNHVQAVLSGTERHLASEVRARRLTDPPLAPFHWAVECPEVFDRTNPGFDAFVGNPPFAGHVTLPNSNVRGYTTWLRMAYEDSGGKADLVAFFFRRAFSLLRSGGCLGLIATNTIAQGDTRVSGLRWILDHGGSVYFARKRVQWPGRAAVVVSVVHVAREFSVRPAILDGRRVDRITAFLFHAGGNDDPIRLKANRGLAFVGSVVNGLGFLFDSTGSNGASTPISEMHSLLLRDPSVEAFIKPYYGGQDINTSPSLTASRFVIDLGDISLEEARQQVSLFSIIEAKVKPVRMAAARRSKSSHSRRAAVWWQHYHRAQDLYRETARLSRVLASARVSQHSAFCFLPTGAVYSEQVVAIAADEYPAFAAVQARPHELWARFFGSSLEDRLRYTPSDCFETFPFPRDWGTRDDLEAAGREYYDYRAALMVSNDEGLTTTYNRFHDPNETDPGIERLRELHHAMDVAVLHAYGWDDIEPRSDFLLDYEIDEETWGRRRKPYRYRWPDDLHDEVLARLLDLNKQRAAEEARAG